MKMIFTKGLGESFKKGFPMKESGNYEDELDDIDAEMDDRKEMARWSVERRKNDYRSDRDYRARHDVGKRFKDLDSIDTEMDDEKEFAKKSYNRAKYNARADRDYRLGKGFPMKEDFSDDTEILWRKGGISIIKDGYGFGIDNGININRFTVYDDGRVVYDAPEAVRDYVKSAIRSLIRQGKLDNPYYKGKDAKYVGNTLRYGRGIKESKNLS